MIGKKLLELRKSKNLSQEEVAEKLNVTRQTVSKWETEQSTPDFDKIVPLCELYEITTDELLIGKSSKEIVGKESEDQIKKKKAKAIGEGIFLYFVSIVWLMITIPVMNMNPIISSAIFLIICGVATYLIVYNGLVYKNKTTKKKEPKFLKQIKTIIYLITLIIYLLISFITMAWHVTWILWIVASLIEEIVKLIFMLKEDQNEE